MIPGYLEQLIWQGKAAPRTWATGGGAVSRIPVKKNSCIVIWQIQWNPLNDEQNQSNLTFKQVMSAYNHRMANSLFLYTSKTKHLFNLRDAFRFVPSPDWLTDGQLNNITQNTNPYSFPTYLIFDENVRVNISKADNAPESWTNADYGAMPDDSDEVNLAQSYGTAIGNAWQTLKNFQFAFWGANDSAIYPTVDQSPLAAVTDQDASYEYQGKTASHQLNNPQFGGNPDVQNGFNFPLVNFSYVEIFEPLPKFMKR